MSTQQMILAVDYRSESLDADQLRELATGRVAAIRLRRFFDPDACRALSRVYESDHRRGSRGPNLFDILGQPHSVVVKQPDPLAEPYFSSPNPVIAALEETARSAGVPSPHSRILETLNVGWPHGCVPERLEYGRDMAPFIIRVYKNGVYVKPHQDRLDVTAPGSASARTLTAQFGVNLYMSMPDQGGGLELWLKRVLPCAYDAHRLPGADSYTIEPSLIGEPLLRIEPEVGDLVLFESSHLHATVPGSGGANRVTLSSFLGLRSESQPITIWA